MGPGHALAATEEGPEAPDGADTLQARWALTSREGLPRPARLRGQGEYRQAFATGTRRRLRFLDVVWVTKDAGQPRLGLVVPRLRSTAVARNRLRRRLREIWRRLVAPGLGPVDVIIRARPEAYQASFQELARDLGGWVDRRRGSG